MFCSSFTWAMLCASLRSRRECHHVTEWMVGEGEETGKRAAWRYRLYLCTCILSMKEWMTGVAKIAVLAWRNFCTTTNKRRTRCATRNNSFRSPPIPTLSRLLFARQHKRNNWLLNPARTSLSIATRTAQECYANSTAVTEVSVQFEVVPERSENFEIAFLRYWNPCQNMYIAVHLCNRCKRLGAPHPHLPRIITLWHVDCSSPPPPTHPLSSVVLFP